MVYLRAKKVKSDSYLYLVKSVWDRDRGTSRQEIIKYLGKASEVTMGDIPRDYRDDPKIASALASHSPGNARAKDGMARRSRDALYRRLLEGDIAGSGRVCADYSKAFGAGDFLDRVLRPVMYRIGDDWEAGRIDIASEHVASNMAVALVKGIGAPARQGGSRGKVMICVPYGEEHHLGCDMLEVALAKRGLTVFNMSTPMPTESILGFIGDNAPDCVLVSITLVDNLAAGRRLVASIRGLHDVPVFVGGQAFQYGDASGFQAEIIPDADAERVAREIGQRAAAARAAQA